MVAGLAPVFGKQAPRAVLLEAPQQTKHLTPLQPNQRTGVTDAQAARLNPQQHLKTAELLLAHRQHRYHGAPPRTPKPGRVSPLYCRGVSSLYCSYSRIIPEDLPITIRKLCAHRVIVVWYVASRAFCSNIFTEDPPD